MMTGILKRCLKSAEKACVAEVAAFSRGMFDITDVTKNVLTSCSHRWGRPPRPQTFRRERHGR